jgi:hypothetical protein
MAIGLSNVNNRKAKRTTPEKTAKKTSVVEVPIEAAPPVELKSQSNDAWSTRGLAREGRSAQRERKVSTGDINMLWLEWTTFVTGTETSTRVLRTVRRILDLETFVFEFLVYELQIPARAKKRILGIRSKSARAFQIKSLLARQ